MEAKELMIGDWVHDDRLNAYTKVEMLTPQALKGDIHITTYPIDTFEPIPLTPEILEKNGFEKRAINDIEPYYQDEDGNYYYQYGEWRIDKPHMWFWYKDGVITLPANCIKWITISYVHELQHALRLIELNELADNFKL